MRNIISPISRFGIVILGISNWLFGSLLLIHVVWTLNTANNFLLIVNGKSLITISQLIFGLLVSIKGLIGIFAACGKQECLLKFFLFLAIMTISLEIGTFISIKVANIEVKEFVDQSWNESNQNTRNYIQKELKCCGLTGLSEFASKLDPIDESCYVEPNNPLSKEPFRVGCKYKLINWINQRRTKFMTMASVFLLFQIMSVVFTLILLRFSTKPTQENESNLKEEMLLVRRQNG